MSSAAVLEKGPQGVFRFKAEGIQRPLVDTKVLSPSEWPQSCSGPFVSKVKVEFSVSDKNLFQNVQNLGVPELCELRLLPDKFEGRHQLLFYLNFSKAESLDHMIYSENEVAVLDFWSQKQTSVASSSEPRFKKKSNYSSQKSREVFADLKVWQKTLEALSSPLQKKSEFERFRASVLEYNRGAPAGPVEKLPFSLPRLDLPLMVFRLSFSEKKFLNHDFSEREILGPKKMKDSDRKALLQGLNLVLLFVKNEEWLKAREALDVLERSSIKDFLPLQSAKFWALKGWVYVKLAERLEDLELRRLSIQKGLGFWRDGLRLTEFSGGDHRVYSEFMLLELLRVLRDQDLFYPALAVIEWALRLGWSEEVLERLNYLRGEALFFSGFRHEAQRQFRTYFEDRIRLPVYRLADRRLVPAAGIWAGDVFLRMGDVSAAAREYSETLEKFPSSRKINFEGESYPDTLVDYPEILFNRAEVWTRLGFEQRALRDLRAFLFFSKNHSEVGFVYYRVGDLLYEFEKSHDKAIGVWRECFFRVPQTLGGQLCRSRLAAEEMAAGKSAPEEWPRLLGEIEKIQYPEGFRPVAVIEGDLRAYLFLLTADAMIRRGDGFQALSRLESTEKIPTSRALRVWLEEYSVIALSGLLKKRFLENRHVEVLSEFERRKKTLFLRFVRHEALYWVARSQMALGVFQEAWKNFEIAEKSKARLGRKFLRPFEDSETTWSALRARLAVEQFAVGKLGRKSVLSFLNQASREESFTLQAWIRFSEIEKNYLEEAKWWQRMRESGAFEPRHLDRASFVLTQAQQKLAALELLEAYLMSEKKSRILENSPVGVESYLRLARLRKDLGRTAEALSVYELLEEAPAQFFENQVYSRPVVIYEKAQLLKVLGKIDEARDSFTKVKNLSPVGSLSYQLADTALKDLSL